MQNAFKTLFKPLRRSAPVAAMPEREAARAQLLAGLVSQRSDAEATVARACGLATATLALQAMSVQRAASVFFLVGGIQHFKWYFGHFFPVKHYIKMIAPNRFNRQRYRNAG